MMDKQINDSNPFGITTGFVILNYNTHDLTKKLALKISKFQAIDYVVIIDNRSTDDSYKFLKPLESDSIIVVDSGKNGGYSFGNNCGARICTEKGVDIIFIANPDINVEEKDINDILDGFMNSDYSMLSGIQYEIDGKVGKPEIWNKRTYKDDLKSCFFITRYLFRKKRGIPVDYSLKIQAVPVCKGSFFAIRLKDYNLVEGFDENVFLYSEERLLADKLRSAGKKIGIVTSARYDHMHSVSISKSYNKKAKRVKMLYDSRLYCAVTYEGLHGIRKMILKRCMDLSLIEYKIMDFIHSNSARGE